MILLLARNWIISPDAELGDSNDSKKKRFSKGSQ